MPEGDTIHKVAAFMRPILEGQKLSGGRLRDYPEANFRGQQVTGVGVHGKHLFLELDRRTVVRTHLGMTGSWHRYAPGERWQRPSRQASVILETHQQVLVCFNAKEVTVGRAGGPGYKALRHRLGPDLLAGEVDYAAIVHRARRVPADTPLTDLLLDQSVASGIGNVYKSELLFLHRLAPSVTTSSLSDEQLVALYRDASGLLAKNLGDGQRTTRFPRDAAGALWVYRRAQKPCLECDTPIRYARLGRHQRGTYFCPRCQGGTSAATADSSG